MLLVAHHVIVYYVKLSCASLSLKDINCIIDSSTFVTMEILRIFTAAFLLVSAQGVPTDCKELPHNTEGKLPQLPSMTAIR